VPFVLVLGLLLAGLAVHGAIGILALLVLAALLGWLLYLSWPVLDRPRRLLRVAVLGAIVALVATRLLL
jgi:hypothetical protein